MDHTPFGKIFLLRCCYLLAGFQPKMLIRSTKRTFFNFLNGIFLYFFYLIYSTLTKVNNFVYKNMQLNYHRIEIKHIFTSDLKTSTMKKQMTIREIRKVLFETEKYTVIGADEMTNKESRDFLYAKDNQDELMNVIDNGSHLLIWK
jgi:hypothetical protein